MYKVVKSFADLQDNKHFYRAGDTFPRAGLEVSAERVAELASVNNKMGVVLIKAAERAQRAKIQPVAQETEKADELAAEKPKKPRKRNKKEK